MGRGLPYFAGALCTGEQAEGVKDYICCILVEKPRRFVKQNYCLEDLRLLDYERLKNLVALTLAAAYFAAVWLGEKLQLTVLARRVAKLAKRFFGIPEFHYYALSDGLRVLLSRFGAWASPKTSLKSAPNSEPQLCLSL